MAMHRPNGRFNPLSAEELLSLKPEPMTWLWQDYIATGDFFVFTAYMKVGKSTFFYPLALAISRGEEFIGYATQQTKVLIIALEEQLRDIQLRLAKLGMRSSDQIFTQPGRFPENHVEAIQSFIDKEDIGLVLIDSLSQLWTINNENDNAQVNQHLAPLMQLAHETKTAIGLIHHDSKYGGQDASGASHGNGKNMRGASAILANVDQALQLDRTNGGSRNRRVLRAIGRRAESPRELIIELHGNPALSDPNPYGYKLIGTSEELDHTSVKENILAVLTTEPQTSKSIVSSVKNVAGEKKVREVLDGLVKDQQVMQSGRGVKSDPSRYRLSFPDPTEHSGAVQLSSLEEVI